MSGKDERPYKEPDFPLCPQCNHNTWVHDRECVESVFLALEDGELIYKWTDDEEATGVCTTWKCRHCGTEPSEELLNILGEYYSDAEWI